MTDLLAHPRQSCRLASVGAVRARRHASIQGSGSCEKIAPTAMATYTPRPTQMTHPGSPGPAPLMPNGEGSF